MFNYLIFHHTSVRVSITPNWKIRAVVVTLGGAEICWKRSRCGGGSFKWNSCFLPVVSASASSSLPKQKAQSRMDDRRVFPNLFQCPPPILFSPPVGIGLAWQAPDSNKVINWLGPIRECECLEGSLFAANLAMNYDWFAFYASHDSWGSHFSPLFNRSILPSSMLNW